MELRTVEKAIIRLQNTYTQGIDASEKVKTEADTRALELRAGITALGELWKILTTDQPIPKIIEDEPVED